MEFLSELDGLKEGSKRLLKLSFGGVATRYCNAQPGGVWDTKLNSGFGAFTPCLVDSIVLGISYVLLLVMFLQRINSLKSPDSRKFALKSKWKHGFPIVITAVCAVVPFVQIFLGISAANVNEEASLPPFEVLILVLNSLTWATATYMLCMDLRVFVKEYVWRIRFATLYLIIAQAGKTSFILELREYFTPFAFSFYVAHLVLETFMLVGFMFRFPSLVPHTGYSAVPTRLVSASEYAEYETLTGDNQTFPERKANVLSRLLFTWMTPLMELGSKKPLQGKDVWDLDTWDQTEILYGKFKDCWLKERVKEKPWLLRALNGAVGKRFWLGGLWKIGNDACQFVGPVFLSLLLEAMQSGAPVWKSYAYAGGIFVGVMIGVICEGQYFQNVMRVGFHIRSTLVAAIFRKSLRLTQTGRKNFGAGRITNLMTTDAESLQQICQQLHSLWSAPLRIVVAMVLLYQQLGVAAIFGACTLVLMFPAQAFIIARMRNLAREGLVRTDKRIGLMNEILNAMDIVKCYAWENSFREKVGVIRSDELSWFRSSQILAALNSFMLNSIPIFVTVLAFGLFSLFGGELTPARAFTSLSLFAVLRFPLFMFPSLITQVVNSNVSLKRLQDLFLSEERDLQENPPIEPGLPIISIKDGSFSWDAQADVPTLSNINMEVTKGELVAIVGGTGEGKTSIVSAILGDLPLMTDTKVVVRGQVAYVAQVSWIFNATVRDNILFGAPYDAVRYRRAVEVSALDRDLTLLPGGDQTEIGERGVNISGGQKQRVSIARAVYSDADVYLFDDPLSALDAHVARQVFDSCIREGLKGKTRILVTNQLHFLSRVDKIILVHEGEIKEQGTYDELYENGHYFKQLMENAGSMEDSVEDKVDEGEDDANARTNDVTPVLEKITSIDRKGSSNALKRTSSRAMEKRSSLKKVKEVKESQSALIRAEERETGIISVQVLDRYKNALGGLWVVAVLFGCYVTAEVVRLSSSGWLSVWTDDSRPHPHEVGYYNGVYAALCLGQVTVTLANSFWLVISSLGAAKRQHDAMLNSILRAPMSFFHANPVGRIINRFSKDTGDIDRNVALFGNMFLANVFQLISTFAMIGFVNTFSLWAILPLLVVFYSAYLYYQSTSREVKRLDSITRSPVYSQFGEALNGLSTIRAYQAYTRMATMNGKSMDLNARYTLTNMGANRWLAVRLEFVGGLMIWLTASLAVLIDARSGDQVSFAPQMGLLLSYALNITSMMTAVLRLASMAENSMNAVERVGNYTDIVPEAPLIVEDQRPPHGWPSDGAVEYKNVLMRYRPDLPPVLHGMSISIKPTEKIGVVGRTGAGKSSMINTLFRIVEPENGQIFIDGCDIQKFGLEDLRKSLGIIPQTPVLFSGSIRFNLDPFSEHNDASIWEALERAHLKDVIRRNAAGLDAQVSEGGENFSVGQRGLLSLARALLRKSKILVLDEATAAVDVGTDALIQKTIRSEFKSCTMIIIAHRLNTIIDSDRILVLDAGKVVEMDTPQRLISNEESSFSAMVRSTGPSNARYLQQIAMGEVDIAAEMEENAFEEQSRLKASAKWARAAKWALALSLTGSHQALDTICQADSHPNILTRTRDAAHTLQEVLLGHHDDAIDMELEEKQASSDSWWSSLFRTVEGLGVMAQQVRSNLRDEDVLEDRSALNWNYMDALGKAEP